MAGVVTGFEATLTDAQKQTLVDLKGRLGNPSLLVILLNIPMGIDGS